jgi:hypothetical protein
MEFTCIADCRPEPLSLFIALPLMAMALATVFGAARLAHSARSDPSADPFPLGGPAPAGVKPQIARMKLVASWLGYFASLVLAIIASSGRVPWW